MTESRKHLRGFASMDPKRRREIASMGGTAAHKQGTAHQFNTAEAIAAGRLGGAARARRLRDARQQDESSAVA